MDEDTMKYLVDQLRMVGGNKVVESKNNTFLVDEDGKVAEFTPNYGAKETLTVKTLESVVDYLDKTSDCNGKEIIVHIYSPTKVGVYGLLDQYGNREEPLEAEIESGFEESKSYRSVEDMIVELQSNFVETDDRDVLLKVLGNLKDDNIKVQTDDGTTQQVTVKTGVASLSGAVVPNPVALKPYRTFIEVDQPESNFVFRMQSGMRTALFLADGNGWKIEAIQNIKKYLTDHIKNEKVHVIG